MKLEVRDVVFMSHRVGPAGSIAEAAGTTARPTFVAPAAAGAPRMSGAPFWAFVWSGKITFLPFTGTGLISFQAEKMSQYAVIFLKVKAHNVFLITLQFLHRPFKYLWIK